MKNLIALTILIVALYFGYGFYTGTDVELTDYDIAQADTIINEFMARYQVPGLSMAWAKDGELLMARAYGSSSIENNIPLSTDHLFRVASVSKPITSVLIMRLVEERKLNLDDTVFGSGGLLEDEYQVSDDNVERITIRHLLEHGAGPEWTNDGNDPMFQNPVMTHQELIQWVLDNRSLKRAPGTTYYYSNFGYSVLGRVIEKVTGMDYQSYFQEVVAPLDLGDFALGSNFSSGGNREVQYYSQEQMQPYGMPVRRMDAHGGWVTTPTAMVNFLMHVDGFPERPDILQASTLREMTVPSLNNNYYAKGWAVNPANNWWHMGSLPGTATVAVRTSDNMVWAVFLNTRSPEANFERELDGLMWQVVQRLGVR
ncbi:MAG: beta-lactamase family protein [Pseudomonadales bacterium]|nr:beta-lactamase family protein [Pseudomonadales bacterium]